MEARVGWWRALTASAATLALLWPTWRLRKRNWRLRLLTSIVSMSTCTTHLVIDECEQAAKLAAHLCFNARVAIPFM